MEDICNVMLEYNMHKEREGMLKMWNFLKQNFIGSLRFAKGKSQTMQTLEGLKERGVQVDLGIPDEVRFF